MRKATWLIPTVYIIFLMLPIYWLVSMSFKTTNEILGSFTLWPQNPTLENYATIFTDPTWYMGYVNSLIYVSLNTVLSVAVALPAAYGLYLAVREPGAVRHAIFLGIFLAFLALEALYDFVLQVPFRESRDWRLLTPYLALYYAMNYGFVVMVWKASLPGGILMLVLFAVQIAINIITHPRKEKA